MGGKKKIFIKKCATCKESFEPGKHKEKLNCSTECLRAYQEKHKEERLKKSTEGIIKKYGVDHISKTSGWSDKVKKIKKENHGDENFNNREKAKKTLLKEYGVDNSMKLQKTIKKIKKTKKENHGDENFNNREKAHQTIKEKYNVDHHLQSQEFIDKMIKTNLKKHNTKYTINTPKAIENLKKKNMETYGCYWYYESEEFIKKVRDVKLLSLQKKLKESDLKFDINQYEKLREKHKDGTMTYLKYTVECRRCGNVFKSRLVNELPICRKCYPINNSSKPQLECREFVNSLNVQYKENTREIISPLELDFFIESKNIAIEFNGNYYHSEISGNKDSKYHIRKTELCSKAGIKLIHIFEDEWLINKAIVKSRIKNAIGICENRIYARNCQIKNISFIEKIKFLEENHIQGNSVDSIRYGLYYNRELISVMTFSKNRIVTGHKKSKEGEFELNRFCSKLNTNVVGGFNKLLKHFISNNDYKSITTYADCRWSGIDDKKTVYNKSGFTFINKTRPSYFYINKKDYYNRLHRFTLNKQTLLKTFNGDPSKTEWQLAQENGFDRIWDCGTMKFELKP